jgi:hypothetical protein
MLLLEAEVVRQALNLCLVVFGPGLAGAHLPLWVDDCPYPPKDRGEPRLRGFSLERR